VLFAAEGQCADVTSVDVVARGSVLRRDPGQLPDGANIDFVSRRSDGNWSIRTYERGVEAETLACGTGAVAAAILLAKWNASTINTTLITRSERVMHVTLQKKCDEWYPSLRGEGRLVFTGQLADR